MPRPLAALLIGGALLLGGCGGEAEPSAEQPRGPLDAKAFRAEVVELCEAGATEIRQVAAGLPEPEVLFERLIEVSQRYQREFEGLTPPASLRRLYDRYLAEGRLGIVVFEKFLEDTRAGTDPIAAYRRLMDRLRPLIRISKETARRLGVPECNRVPGENLQEA